MGKKKVYTLKDFCGIDARQGGCSKNSLSYIKNLIPKDGILKKRFGWNVLYSFRNSSKVPIKINGIFEYGGYLIIHAGTELYKSSYDLMEREKISITKGYLLDQRSMGFVHCGILFLCGGGPLLTYDGTSVKTIYDYKNPYVPTTSIGIPDSPLGEYRAEHESPNLLVPQRINKLRGQYLKNEKHIFKLDAVPRQGTPFTVTVKIRVIKSDETPDDTVSNYRGWDAEDEEYRGILTLVMHTDSLTENDIPCAQPINEWGEPIRMKADIPLWCSVKGNVLTIPFNCPTPVFEQDNITVEFTADTSGTPVIDKVQLCTLCTAESGGSVLLLSTGDNRLIYTHSLGDLFYFPEKNVIPIGSDSEPISAIVPMWDNYICVYKKKGLYRVRIGEDNTVVYSGEDEDGCINSLAATRLNGDCLSLGNYIVYSIRQPEATDKIVTRLTDESLAISPLLKSHSLQELEGAAMVTYEGQLYLFIGDSCYVGQKQGNVYHWYLISPCPAYSPAVTEKGFYMGRENGDIALFHKGYRDMQTNVLFPDKGDYLFQKDGDFTYAFFNTELGVTKDSRLCLDTHYTFIAQCTYSRESGKILVPKGYFYDKNMNMKLFEGMKIRLCDQSGEILYDGEITDTSPWECTISTGFTYSRDIAVALYLQRGLSQEYTLMQREDADNHFFLMYDGSPAKLFDTNISLVHILGDMDIETVLCTQPLDFGTHLDKHLFAVEITPSLDTQGKIKIGCDTRKHTQAIEVSLDSRFSLDDMDFSSLGFNPLFKRCVRMKTLERSFDYAKIRVESHSNKPFGIEQINLVYSHGRE